MNTPQKKILFCRSGGGMPGLDIHMGIWLGLEELGIRSTMNSGTSAGAIVAACDSVGKGPAAYHGILRELKDSDVRRERFAWKLRALWIDWFLSHKPIAILLERMLPMSMNDLLKPLVVWATRESDGIAYALERELVPLRKQVLASISIAGVFPPVQFEDWSSRFSDGGTTNYVGLVPDWYEFDEVWLLIATPPHEYKPKRESIITRMIMNAHVLMQQHIRTQTAEVTDQGPLVKGKWPKVYVIRPECGRDSGVLRFDHKLIEEARKETLAQIDEQRG